MALSGPVNAVGSALSNYTASPSAATYQPLYSAATAADTAVANQAAALGTPPPGTTAGLQTSAASLQAPVQDLSSKVGALQASVSSIQAQVGTFSGLAQAFTSGAQQLDSVLDNVAPTLNATVMTPVRAFCHHLPAASWGGAGRIERPWRRRGGGKGHGKGQ